MELENNVPLSKSFSVNSMLLALSTWSPVQTNESDKCGQLLNPCPPTFPITSSPSPSALEPMFPVVNTTLPQPLQGAGVALSTSNVLVESPGTPSRWEKQQQHSRPHCC